MTLVSLVKELEGVRLQVYKDSADLDTIGIGHLLTKTELLTGVIVVNKESFQYNEGLTEGQVVALFNQDIEKFKDAVTKYLEVAVRSYQYKALVSFCFNVGIGAFKKSTLLKKVNERLLDEVPTQFMRWIYSGGNFDKADLGLANRRKKEVNMWLGKYEKVDMR